jgi:hypothetical protein
MQRRDAGVVEAVNVDSFTRLFPAVEPGDGLTFLWGRQPHGRHVSLSFADRGCWNAAPAQAGCSAEAVYEPGGQE